MWIIAIGVSANIYTEQENTLIFKLEHFNSILIIKYYYNILLLLYDSHTKNKLEDR